MSSLRPSIWVDAFIDTNPIYGIIPEYEAYLRKYFEVITSADLEQDITKSEKVKGAIPFVPTANSFNKYLHSFTNLKAVAVIGAGVDFLDLKELAGRGITVSNTPGVTANALAEMTLGLMLASGRNIVTGDHTVKNVVQSSYRMDWYSGVEIKGSTVGIVGMGATGLVVARLVKAFGGNVIYHNRNRRSVEDEQSVDATYYEELDQLLAVSDFVVILCPLTAATQHLIGRQQLSIMKNTAILVNVSRGRVVDTDALVDALSSKQIGGAALDVTDPEPLPPGHPLRSAEGVVMTPHAGVRTFSTLYAMFKMSVDNLRAALIDNTDMPNEIDIKAYF